MMTPNPATVTGEETRRDHRAKEKTKEERTTVAADSMSQRSKVERRAKGNGRGSRVSQIMLDLGISPGQASKMAPHFTDQEAEALAEMARRMEPDDLGAYAARVFADHLVQPA